jgi:hypothetical protein
MKATLRLKFDLTIEPVDMEGSNEVELHMSPALESTVKNMTVTFARLIGSTLAESEVVGGTLEVMVRPFDPTRPSVTPLVDNSKPAN